MMALPPQWQPALQQPALYHHEEVRLPAASGWALFAPLPGGAAGEGRSGLSHQLCKKCPFAAENGSMTGIAASIALLFGNGYIHP